MAASSRLPALQIALEPGDLLGGYLIHAGKIHIGPVYRLQPVMAGFGLGQSVHALLAQGGSPSCG